MPLEVKQIADLVSLVLILKHNYTAAQKYQKLQQDTAFFLERTEEGSWKTHSRKTTASQTKETVKTKHPNTQFWWVDIFLPLFSNFLFSFFLFSIGMWILARLLVPWLHFSFTTVAPSNSPVRKISCTLPQQMQLVFPDLPLPSFPGYCVKLVCIHPIRYHGQIQKGQQLGRMLPMQKVFPGIVSHIHVENCDQSDPTHLLRPIPGKKNMQQTFEFYHEWKYV